MRRFFLIIAVAGCNFVLGSCDVRRPSGDSHSTTCEVYLGSSHTGRVDVVTMDPNSRLPFTIPLQMFWHPPASNETMDFVIGYSGSTLGHLQKPSGARIQFEPLKGVAIEAYEAEVNAGGNLSWRFGSDQIRVGTRQVDLLFPAAVGPEVYEAIDQKKPIKVTIFNSRKVAYFAVFDTSATVERDHLFDEAKHLIESRDSKFCRNIEY